MKRIVALFLCLTCGLLFAAGGGEAKTGLTPVNYKLAHVYQPDHPFSVGMKQLAAMVSEKQAASSHHRTSGAARKREDLCNSLVDGVVEMAIIGPGEIGKRFSGADLD